MPFTNLLILRRSHAQHASLEGHTMVMQRCLCNDSYLAPRFRPLAFDLGDEAGAVGMAQKMNAPVVQRLEPGAMADRDDG